MHPLLSVIIPHYNSAQFVCPVCGRTIGLHALITHPRAADVEVIVVDDGSPDGRLSMSQSVSSKLCFPNLILLHQSHLGAAAARNCGLAQARGAFVWFVDADDSVLPQAWDHVLSVLDTLPLNVDCFKMGPMHFSSHPAQGVVADDQALQLGGVELVFRQQDPRCGGSSVFDHTTYIFRRTFLSSHYLHQPEDMHLLEDSLFVLHVLRYARIVAVNDTYRFYCYLRNLQSATRQAWLQQLELHFLPDMIRFFSEFRQYASAEVPVSPDSSNIPPSLQLAGSVLPIRALYDRYLYVYLRVLAVKGSPWRAVSTFRQQASVPGTFYFGTSNLKMRLLANAPIHRAFLFFCRLAVPVVHHFRKNQ